MLNTFTNKSYSPITIGVEINISKVGKNKTERHLKDHIVHIPQFIFRKLESHKLVLPVAQ